MLFEVKTKAKVDRVLGEMDAEYDFGQISSPAVTEAESVNSSKAWTVPAEG